MFYVRCRQHGTATAPLPHSSAVRPHPPPVRTRSLTHRTARTLTAHTSPAQSLARTVLRHRRALPAPDSARLPAEVLKLQGLSFCQSISNFVVSLPNVSKKDVKGLLFRKQPLHTSPNRSKRGEAGVSRLSSLRNLTSPPRLCPRVERQSDCSKPERFDELALA